MDDDEKGEAGTETVKPKGMPKNIPTSSLLVTIKTVTSMTKRLETEEPWAGWRDLVFAAGVPKDAPNETIEAAANLVGGALLASQLTGTKIEEIMDMLTPRMIRVAWTGAYVLWLRQQKGTK